MYYIYILQSQRDEGYYVGLTKDTGQRLKYHNAGRVKSTKHRVPFRLLYTERYENIRDARDREKWLKSYRGSKEKLDILDSLHGPIV